MIEVRRLVKTFGDFRAVDDVSFQVPGGKIFGFLGPNGAGKTTTIKMLTTILQPTAGSIRIDGHDPQRDPSVDSELTAWENMELHGVLYGVPAAERQERIGALLEFVELSERRDDCLKQFSGGMTRRLELARALLHQPRLLFLDEPTAGLDPQTRNHIWKYIQLLSKERGMTVFFTTHYMEEAERVADEVAVIDHGRIVAQDAPAALKEKAQTASLEEAFIKLTGHDIRDEESTVVDQMRKMGRLWGNKR